ncbi:nitric oxide reductase activation protein NorD [Nitrosomonas sp. HPC101]|uniref:nitric oxide reductase activation protein NorD n=1 Tax=Nitrosomonas sp. HPC101 TaxID=1658667 RepID=UPI00136E6ED5|nr:nitric oxide reductase activation protein NorD [Nitrosomonas sp. HPC101]MXS85142.1 nitric oxide reductase activation protein NorD [Nitrosomonas sp. HPC101]
MSINLTDYSEELESLQFESRALLEKNWRDATKDLSPRGIDNYLKGASALQALGRGRSLVDVWINEIPKVVREVGDDVISELATACLKLSSKTSGSVVELIIATSSIAAGRLGDADLFRNYLQFLNTFIAQAPRGIRPMLDNLDVLFNQLTLGGLRRWALWGAHAHRTDYEAQLQYFSLGSKESQAVLKKERKGTLFVDVQRRINIYLRALWARDFYMRPTSGDFENREGYRPFIDDYIIHLPDAFDAYGDVSAVEVYRAAAAHSAAHLVETKKPISAESLNPLQMAVIAVIEDARVEALSIRRFPGLRQTWSALHTATPAMETTIGDYLNRLAHALLDPDYPDMDEWVVQGRLLFARAQDNLEDNQISWDIGVQLAHELMSKRIPFNPRTDILSAPYRDDNRYFWEFEEFDFERSIAAGYGAPKQVRRRVSLMEFINETECEFAGDDANEVWILDSELFPYEDNGISYNTMWGKEQIASPHYYSEWDYKIQLERPEWSTIQEKRAELGDIQIIDDIAAQYKKEIQRIKFLFDAMQPQGVQRMRKLEDGDEIDINAAVSSLIDIRMGQFPDPRVMMRSVRKVRDISVLVLLDLSESTNNMVNGQEFSVLDLTRQATVLLADAIHRIGDPFAIHGFCSDGRHDVEYFRFKDFDQPYSEIPKMRLAGMTGQLSTRMGAAIRHASYYLKLQASAKKLLLVITDGEPADVDVRDPQYLRFDTKKAVEEAGRSGIMTYCMSLDPSADQYVSRIFGMRNYMVVDRVERLPEKLPLLYAGLTR